MALVLNPPELAVKDELCGYLETTGVAIPNDNNFHSIGQQAEGAVPGPVILRNQRKRVVAQIVSGANAGQPVGGMQVQIVGKASPNAPAVVIWSWAALQALGLSTSPISSTPPMYVFAPGQSTVILPAASSLILDMDVEGWYSIDPQVSVTSSATGSNTAGLYLGMCGR
jgi:hypothetical protein